MTSTGDHDLEDDADMNLDDGHNETAFDRMYEESAQRGSASTPSEGDALTECMEEYFDEEIFKDNPTNSARISEPTGSSHQNGEQAYFTLFFFSLN